MGNAQARENHCGVPQCGIAPPTAKKQHANLVASVRALEEIQATTRTTNTAQQPPEEKPGKFVLKTIKTTLKGIFDPAPEPPPLPPKRPAPKHLLYGCSTAEEHFEYIDQICEKVSNLQGQEGLEVMGFDFRVVHHTKNCECPGVERDGDDDDLTDTSSVLDPEEMKEGYLESSEEGDDFGQFDDEVSENGDEKKTEMQSFMVPLGSPLKIPEDKLAEAAGLPNFQFQTSPYASTNISRNTSTLSLFSLATHNTEFSNPTETSTRRKSNGMSGSIRASGRIPLSSIASSPSAFVMEQDSCALRLHHTSSNTVITAENHNTYLADGKFYDQLARLCMEHAQQVMMEEANLEWVTVNEEPKKYGAIVSKGFVENRKNARANNAKHRTLLVVTGKGQVEAGMFSRRHLLVTSMEAATALPFLREAQDRGMDIVMLDPNSLGSRNGMDVVEKSLEYFFMDENSLTDNEEVYILAHSMAGAQIVRFFINNSSCHRKSPATLSKTSSTVSDASSTVSNGTSNGSSVATNNPSAIDRKLLRSHFLDRVKAFAFTDSNHNLNWVKNNPKLKLALTGPPSLYIKSHKVHEKAKDLGEAHHDCQFWRHRFGDIKTLWAGTHEHALTNYTARAHIWEHFDQFFEEPAQLEQGDQSAAVA